MRLHRPSGQALITVEGRTIYLGAFGSTDAQIAYEREVAQWRAHGIVTPKRGTVTVSDLVAAFWQRIERDGLYEKNGKPTSERLCLRVALRPVLRLFGAKLAAEFGPRDLGTVRKALCSPLPPPGAGEKRRRVHTGPIVRSSVNKHLHRIRGVFRWATAMELVPVTTWQALLAVEPIRRGQAIGTRESRPVKPAPLRAVVRVLRVVSAPVAAMIRLQWLTGMRPGEVLQMRLGDIDRTRDVWIYRPGSHKTEHHDIEREVPLGPKARRVLASFLSLDAAAFLFPGRKKKRPGPMTEAAYCRAVTRACGDGERWTPNQLRHNAGTRFRQLGGIEAARSMLGHTDAGTTLIYAEADRQKAIAMARAMG